MKQHRRVTVTRTSGQRVTVEVMRYLTLEEARAEAQFRHTLARHSIRARNFLAANETSPVVYGSVNDNCVTYRLENGKIFRLTLVEAQSAPRPWWAHRTLAQHRAEELALLAAVEGESRQPDPGRWER